MFLRVRRHINDFYDLTILLWFCSGELPRCWRIFSSSCFGHSGRRFIVSYRVRCQIDPWAEWLPISFFLRGWATFQPTDRVIPHRTSRWQLVYCHVVKRLLSMSTTASHVDSWLIQAAIVTVGFLNDNLSDNSRLIYHISSCKTKLALQTEDCSVCFTHILQMDSLRSCCTRKFQLVTIATCNLKLAISESQGSVVMQTMHSVYLPRYSTLALHKLLLQINCLTQHIKSWV